MTEINSMYKTLLKAMVDLPTRDNVLPKYQIILARIKKLFSDIKNSQNFAETKIFFDELEELQAPLSRLVFREKIDDYESINQFVRDFDRIDDMVLRQEMYELIKEDKYLL